jgi:tetratricopeptide (TPR) repeat protein
MVAVHPSPSVSQNNPDVTLPAPVPAGPTNTDLQALNFYLQQKDQASIEAELRRLRGKFPGWSLPADLTRLTVTSPSTEIDTIYAQIAEGQLAQARATIAATKVEYTSWTVPADMERLLSTAEGQVQLDTALDAGSAAEALQIASSVDGLLRCDRVNNAWRIAKAQEAQSAVDAAVGTYRAILGACTEFSVIIATLEKSDTVTTETQLTELFDAARSRFPTEQVSLAELQARLIAGRVTAPAKIAIAVDATKKPRSRPAQSSSVPNEPADPGPPANPTDTDVTGGTGSGCLASTEGAMSAARLMERAWCAYDLDRPMEAMAAFRTAESRLGGAQRRDARFGLALSYLRLNMTEEASRVAATTDFTRKQRVETESIILNQRGVRAFEQRQYTKAIGYFDALEQVSGQLRRDLALLRGYAYLNGGNQLKALEIFRELHDQLATAQTRNAIKAATID